MCLCKENTGPLEQRLPPRASVGICPNSYFLNHPFWVEDFPSPGGCDGIGIQFPSILQPVSDLMGFHSDLGRAAPEEILRGGGGAQAVKVFTGPWSPGTLGPVSPLSGPQLPGPDSCLALGPGRLRPAITWLAEHLCPRP